VRAPSHARTTGSIHACHQTQMQEEIGVQVVFAGGERYAISPPCLLILSHESWYRISLEVYNPPWAFGSSNTRASPSHRGWTQSFLYVVLSNLKFQLRYSRGPTLQPKVPIEAAGATPLSYSLSIQSTPHSTPAYPDAPTASTRPVYSSPQSRPPKTPHPVSHTLCRN
jgi:hypothetical protein